MSDSPVLPRGTPLTPTMEITALNGVRWVAYVEALPAVRKWRLLSQTVLPGRQMRFDSADETRMSPTVPAGAPFLPERRLLALLAQATSLSPARLPIPLRRRRGEVLRAAARRWWGWVSGYAARAGRESLNWVLTGNPFDAGRRTPAHPAGERRYRDQRMSRRRGFAVHPGRARPPSQAARARTPGPRPVTVGDSGMAIGLMSMLVRRQPFASGDDRPLRSVEIGDCPRTKAGDGK